MLLAGFEMPAYDFTTPPSGGRTFEIDPSTTLADIQGIYFFPKTDAYSEDWVIAGNYGQMCTEVVDEARREVKTVKSTAHLVARTAIHFYCDTANKCEIAQIPSAIVGRQTDPTQDVVYTAPALYFTIAS